uniref:MYG1 exonuclease n=1 Tax=Sarcophilus harrisii TaxID=9305 RepID=G3VSV9_SARHA
MGHLFLRSLLFLALPSTPLRASRRLGLEPAPSSKRPRAEPMAPARPRIGTHNGTFHCDEALACALLRLLPEYREAEILRTRDPALLATCDVVVDVGGEYDPQRHRYDHHQRSFTESMSSLRPGKPWQTKLSSAGLVYLHFGQRLLAQLLGTSIDDRIVDTLYDKAGFHCAMNLVREEFVQRLDFYKRSWLPARALVEEALANRFQVDPSGEIIELSQGGCPWKDHLFDLEPGLTPLVPIAFVLYPDQNGQWRVQCVPKELHSFESRLPLPEQWQGLRDEALDQMSGIPGCIFVHANGFIGGHRTKEGALSMARATLAQRLTPLPSAECQ